MKPVKLSVAIIAMCIAALLTSCTKDEVKPSALKLKTIMEGGGSETPPQLPPPPPPR
ncbi:hypothetical protein [Mucilaginibacter gynuensis]|uniref:hypothetical protein n=1 Tax=Mucilaginibacter gynuensis TaxID=1302236 RepID=UPI0031EF4CA4